MGITHWVCRVCYSEHASYGYSPQNFTMSCCGNPLTPTASPVYPYAYANCGDYSLFAVPAWS